MYRGERKVLQIFNMQYWRYSYSKITRVNKSISDPQNKLYKHFAIVSISDYQYNELRNKNDIIPFCIFSHQLINLYYLFTSLTDFSY